MGLQPTNTHAVMPVHTPPPQPHSHLVKSTIWHTLACWHRLLCSAHTSKQPRLTTVRSPPGFITAPQQISTTQPQPAITTKAGMQHLPEQQQHEYKKSGPPANPHMLALLVGLAGCSVHHKAWSSSSKSYGKSCQSSTHAHMRTPGNKADCATKQKQSSVHQC